MAAHPLKNQSLLNTLYEPVLAERPYSFAAMAREVEKFARLELPKIASPLERYLLLLRTEYLIREVCLKPDTDFAKALIGIFSIAPRISQALVTSNGVNVFLARDAAREFVTAELLNKEGLQEGVLCLVYISRQNARHLYKAAKRILESSYARKPDISKLFAQMAEEFRTNSALRGEAIFIRHLLEEAGVLAYRDIRFIDAWASGTIFFALTFVVNFLDEFQYENGIVSERRNKQQHRVTCATANNKERVMVVETPHDYANVERDFSAWWRLPEPFYLKYKHQGWNPFPVSAFDCSSVSADEIRRWYRFYGVSLGYRVRPDEFCELLSSQIYKGLNHFGSLNLGHPIEWDAVQHRIVAASAAKRVGNLLRNLFLINAVHGYQTSFAPISQEVLPRIILPNRTPILAKKFGLDERQAQYLDRVLYDNNEHIVTCHSLLTESLVQNVVATMRFFGFRTIANMSRGANYNFQYYLNGIKSIPDDEYAECLEALYGLYSKRVLRQMLLHSTYHFVRELRDARTTRRLLDGPIKTLVFDIDGTLTPLTAGVPLLAECLRAGFSIAFITGRPRSQCEALASGLYGALPRRFSPAINRVTFYCSNGAEAFSADGSVTFPRKKISTVAKRKILRLWGRFGFNVSSMREYRMIATYSGPDVNPNRLLVYRDRTKDALKDTELGVYLIVWEARNLKQNHYNALDVCSSNKGEALRYHLSHHDVGEYLVLVDDPTNSDREILGEHTISVEGYGIMKTRAIISYLRSRSRTGRVKH